jgi:acetyl esterase/lipase
MRRATSALLVLLLALAACSSSDDDEGGSAPATTAAGTPETTTEASTTTTTAGDDAVEAQPATGVYDVPDPLPAGEPGDVIEVEPLPEEYADVEGASAMRVLYHSRSIDGEDIAVSGLVFRPPGEAPEGGFPVVTWAHGTTGTADQCAPSREEGPPVPFLDDALRAGYVVAATDYQGLGTPGLHPYLVGGSEGRGVLDAVRAAQDLPGVDAGSTVVVWGHSQGGHAALFAGELAASYAPELDVRGVVAIAPAGDLSIIAPAVLRSGPLFPFAFLALGTWAQEYPQLDLTTLFTPTALERLPLLDTECTDEVFAAFTEPIESLVVSPDVGSDPALVQLFVDNTAGARPLSGPYLVTQGEADEIVPLALTDLLAPKLCSAGATVDYRRYPGATHGSVLGSAHDDILAWTADRFAGAPAATTC